MSSNDLSPPTENTLFDAICEFDENGQKQWFANNLIHLLGKPIKTHHSVLTAEQSGLLILEAAAMTAMERYYGVTTDSWFLWSQALNVYKGQSATLIFHSVAVLIKQAEIWEFSEKTTYPFIAKYWDEIAPVPSKLIRVSDDYETRHIPDFFAQTAEERIPVEVKQGEFNLAHLRQLDRYMKAYKSSTGIAIAEGLKKNVVMPPNVMFIAFGKENIRQLEGYKPLSELLKARATEFVSR